MDTRIQGNGMRVGGTESRPCEGGTCEQCGSVFARSFGSLEATCPACRVLKKDDGKGYLPADPERTPTPHYMRGGIECIDAMRAIATPEEFQAFCRLTAFKYLWRLGEKDKRTTEAKKCLDYVRWMYESMKGSKE